MLLHQPRASGQGSGRGDLQQTETPGGGHPIPTVHPALHHCAGAENINTEAGRSIQIDDFKFLQLV